VCIPSGEVLFFALGTGEYNELAREFSVLLDSTLRLELSCKVYTTKSEWYVDWQWFPSPSCSG
jgi:hypothetical protein